jgi:hypothetical protein
MNKKIALHIIAVIGLIVYMVLGLASVQTTPEGAAAVMDSYNRMVDNIEGSLD